MAIACQSQTNLKQNSSKKNDKQSSEVSVAKELLDTIGLSNAPVKIEEDTIEKIEGNDRSLIFKYRNISKKTIDKIIFKWYIETAFAKPATLGSEKGIGGTDTDMDVEPDEASNLAIQLLSHDAKKAVLIWPVEVFFADGTKWRIRN